MVKEKKNIRKKISSYPEKSKKLEEQAQDQAIFVLPDQEVFSYPGIN